MDSLSPGEQFHHYLVQETLGMGGMGIVYKVLDTRLNRVIALKIIRSEDITETEANRFLREVMVHAQLNHPNIVKLLEVGERPFRYFTMEYIEGHTLFSLINNNKVSISEAAYCIQKIAEALYHIHQLGIIHRDIKSANIMINSEGQPKLMDFGLVKVSHLKHSLSQTGDIIGTPWYMPPEQVKGRKVDIRSDIYSLGATLYEALTGTYLFTGSVHQEIFDKILTEEPAPPSSIYPDIPKKLDAICVKCVQKNPRQRYKSTQSLANALKNFLNRDSTIVGTRPKKAAPYALYFITILLLTIFTYVLIAKQITTKSENSTITHEAFLAARSLHKEGMYNQALDKYSQAIAIDPKSIAAYYHRGKLYIQLKNYQRGKDDFDKVIDFDPDNKNAHYERAMACHYHLHDKNQAQKDYIRTLELAPNSGEVHYHYGKLLAYKLKNYKQANKHYQKLIEFSPQHKRIYYHLGHLYYYHFKQVEQAQVFYTKAIALAPKYAPSYYERGRLFDDSKKYKNAVDDYSRVIKLQPHHKKAHYYRGYLYHHRLQQYQKALEDYDKVVELDPKYPKIYYIRGYLCHDHLGKYHQAVENYSKTIELNSQVQWSYYKRGCIYQDHLKEYKKAVEDYSKNIELDPKHLWAHYKRAYTYHYYLQDYAKAIQGYTNVIALYPKYKWAYANRGKLYLKLKQIKKAAVDLKKAGQLPD